MPSLGWAVTERWSVALSPTLTLGQAAVDPFLFAAPDDADGSGAARYPQGSGARMQWGGGFQVSSYFKLNEQWSSGAMYRSAQWLQEVENQSIDELGRPRTVTANFDLPQIVSVGVSYQGIPETVVAFDARYIGYASSPGWGDSGFRGDGSLAGLGFSDAYMLGAGIQRRLGSRFTARGGYTFNSSLLSDSEATIAVFAPLFYQHVYSLGGAIHLGAQTDFNFAYSYSPENQLSGPMVTPAGAVPGSNVTTQISVHAASVGVSVRY